MRVNIVKVGKQSAGFKSIINVVVVSRACDHVQAGRKRGREEGKERRRRKRKEGVSARKGQARKRKARQGKTNQDKSRQFKTSEDQKRKSAVQLVVRRVNV